MLVPEMELHLAFWTPSAVLFPLCHWLTAFYFFGEHIKYYRFARWYLKNILTVLHHLIVAIPTYLQGSLISTLMDICKVP